MSSKMIVAMRVGAPSSNPFSLNLLSAIKQDQNDYVIRSVDLAVSDIISVAPNATREVHDGRCVQVLTEGVCREGESLNLRIMI